MTTTNREEILLEALSERYRSLAVIRDRVQAVALWVLGLLAAASGWIIVEHPLLSCERRVSFSLMVIVIFLLLRLIYFRDLQRGFVTQQRVAVRIETELGLYGPELNKSGQGESIYPESWQKAGNTDGGGRFFKTNSLLLLAGVILFLVVLWI
jgi:hypothetical protein